MFQSLQLGCIQTSRCSGYFNVCVRHFLRPTQEGVPWRKQAPGMGRQSFHSSKSLGWVLWTSYSFQGWGRAGQMHKGHCQTTWRVAWRGHSTLPTSPGTWVWKRGQKVYPLTECSQSPLLGSRRGPWRPCGQTLKCKTLGQVWMTQDVTQEQGCSGQLNNSKPLLEHGWQERNNCLGVVSIQWGKNVSATWNGIQRKPPVGGDNGS